MQKPNLLYLIFVLTSFASVEGHAQTSQWPAGINVCQGSWKYNEYNSCENEAHGPDQSRPIYSTGGACGYESKASTCFNGDEFSRVVDTPIEEIRRNDTGWETAEVQNICNSKSPGIAVNSQEHIAAITIGFTGQGQECRKRDWKKKCQAWTKKLNLSCHFVVNTKVNRPNAAACGTEVDLSRPVTCQTGLSNIIKHSASCGSFQELTAPRGLDATGLKAEDWRFGFTCPTGDDLIDGTLPDVKNKYSILLNLLAKAQGTEDETAIKSNLKSLASIRADLLDDVEKENISRITNQTTVSANIELGTYFDANSDCASKADGSNWYCNAKKVNLGLDKAIYFNDLINYTSLKLKFAYVFQCKASRGSLNVKANLNTTSLRLTPTSNEEEQYLEVAFNSKDSLSTLEFNPSDGFSSNPGCFFKSTRVEIDLDENLLKATLQSQIQQFNQLQSTKSKLNSAKQLPEKYSSIQTLKDDMANRILDTSMACRTVANSLNKDVDATCPVIENFAEYCKRKMEPSTPELQSILDKMHNDSCLLSDVEAALPAASPCLTDSSRQCLEEVNQVVESVEQAMIKSNVEFRKISDALKFEMQRVKPLSDEAYEKVRRIKEDIDQILLNSSGQARSGGANH
ncbi:MAG: hypothetical protein H7318_14835 [Oligoflexus sp.]|nr:hypothetical protein [Oligoflexus sp.]